MRVPRANAIAFPKLRGVTKHRSWSKRGGRDRAGSVVTVGSPPRSESFQSAFLLENRNDLRPTPPCGFHKGNCSDMSGQAIGCRPERRFSHRLSVPQRADEGHHSDLECVHGVMSRGPFIRPACRRGGRGGGCTELGNDIHCPIPEQIRIAASGRIDLKDDAVPVVVGHICPRCAGGAYFQESIP